MPFPVTPILDNFNRADGGLGTNWTSPVPSTDATPTILTNVVIAGSGVFASSYWNRLTSIGETECYCTVPAVSTGFSQVEIYGRLTTVGAGTTNGYSGKFDVSGGIDVTRYVNGGSSGSLLHLTGNTAAGHKCGIAVKTSGSNYVIEVWKDTGSGWSQLGAYTDVGRASSNPVLGSGTIGFREFGDATVGRSIDDFGGGAPVEVSDTPFPPAGRGATW